MSEQAGRYQRSAAGMVGAMLVLLVVVGAFVAFRDLNRNEPATPVRPVEYQQTAASAREQATFDVLVPDRLPEGWRATSVQFTPKPAEHWHLGVLTDEDRYVGLEQRASPVRSMVETYVDRAAVKGQDVTVAGATWQTWSDEEGDTALVRRERKVTTLVVGTPELEVLTDYVRILR